MRTRRFAIAASLLALGACNFDITNTNQPTLDDFINHPTRSNLGFQATGLFAGARGGIQSFIWRAGSMGREGINLSGNNQPDFTEPFFGPLEAGGSFGDTQWNDRYTHILSINVYLAALAKAPAIAADPVHGLSASEKAGSRGVANTLKALAFLYVIELRAQLGAPVDVYQPLTGAPAPFVREDSVYKYIVALLDSAQRDLVRADSTAFPFPIPPGFSGGAPNAMDFSLPVNFLKFNRALAAKANVLRATDQGGCAGNRAACYDTAVAALSASFRNAAATTTAALQQGAYFDFSIGSGDVTNSLSDPLSAKTFYGMQDNVADADTQATPGAIPDQRVLSKLAAAQDTQIALLGSIPIPGQLKFVLYYTNGSADASRPIPIIKNEELVLLDAEAQWFRTAPNKAQAIADLTQIRQISGGLAATTVTTGSTDAAFVTALMKERRYSLLWEQGTRWIDARRFGRLSDIPTDIPASFGTPGNVPPVMPVPQSECNARNLTASLVIPDVVTCTPPTS